MKASHQALMDKVEEVTGQLKEERLKSLGLENQLHSVTFSQIRTEEVTFIPTARAIKSASNLSTLSTSPYIADHVHSRAKPFELI